MKNPIVRLFEPQHLLRKIKPEGELPDGRQVLRRTMQMAWPSMLESFLVSLVGVIDTIMVSGLGSYAIAAVGLTNQPKFIGLAIFLSLNVAVSAIVARRKGENDRESANKVLSTALLITLILTVIISIVCVIFAEDFMRLAGAQEDTLEPSTGYFKIVMGGMVFNVLSMVINAAQRGAGNTKIAMRTNLVSNGINIVFNYLLIGGNLGFPAWGVNGAAVATVLGTVVAAVMSVISVCKRDGFLNLKESIRGFRLESRILKSIANLGSSTLAEQLFLRVGFMIYALIVANLGTTAFAAHQIGMNLTSISFSVADGLSVASVALVGQSLGQRRPDLARLYGASCQRIGLACSILLAVIYFNFGKQLFSLFSNEEPILQDGVIICRMVVIIVFFQIVQVIYSGCLRGAGDTRFVALVSLISVAIVRPLSAYIMCYPMGLGLMGVWGGFAVDQCIRMTMTSIRFAKGKWTTIKV